MRVLFCTYDLALERRGGGERVMVSLGEELRRQGAQVEFFDPWIHDPAEFDCLHYFSTKQPETWRILKREYPNLPLVVTPTFPVAARPGRLLRESFPYPDLFLPASQEEGAALARWVPGEKMALLPNGISPMPEVGPAVFRERTGIDAEDLVLCVGRFDPVKNQMQLIEAMGRIPGGKCVFIGGADSNYPAYFDQCKARALEVTREAGCEIVFLGEIPHGDRLLASAYAAARVFVQPSLFETFGLAALEAAVAGCNLALTSGIASKSMFGSGVEFFDPADADSCAGAILRSLKKSKPGRRNSLSEEYSWSKIASRLEKLYRDLINVGSIPLE